MAARSVGSICPDRSTSPTSAAKLGVTGTTVMAMIVPPRSGVSPGGIGSLSGNGCNRFDASGGDRNPLDLDHHLGLGKTLHGDRGAGREILAEEFAAQLGH